MALLNGCAWLQATRPPTVAERLAGQPLVMSLLNETGQVALLDRSEITFLLPPDVPAAYWACLRHHRKAEADETSRWVLPIRWRPVMPSAALWVPAPGEGWVRLESAGAGRGLVGGVPTLGPFEHLANGNLVRLSTPLPPLKHNPCRAQWSAAYPPTA